VTQHISRVLFDAWQGSVQLNIDAGSDAQEVIEILYNPHVIILTGDLAEW
jgi:hypothetical protein